MEKWKLARYVIDAKKSIDSILYISQNLKEIQGIDVRAKVQSKLKDYYINCRVVIDKVFYNGKLKRELREKRPGIRSILYEADKNYAHKDPDYVPREYQTLAEQVEDLKMRLAELKEVCGEALPENLTLDYVSHDRELFRLVNGITHQKEEEMKRQMHPLYDAPGESFGKPLKVFHDTEDKIEGNREDYCVLLEDGINGYEGLQNRQDWCIKMNVLFKENCW